MGGTERSPLAYLRSGKFLSHFRIILERTRSITFEATEVRMLRVTQRE